MNGKNRRVSGCWAREKVSLFTSLVFFPKDQFDAPIPTPIRYLYFHLH